MSKQIENYCSDHCCACFDDDITELQTENARLREAAEHYMRCNNCNEMFICVTGQTLAQKAKMDFKYAKAV